MTVSEDPPAAIADFPGRKLGVVGLLLSMTIGVVGLIVSAVALVVSRRDGRRNAPALAGIVIGIAWSVAFAAAIWFFSQYIAGNIGPCAELEPSAETTKGYACER
jgi:hypothetical protein